MSVEKDLEEALMEYVEEVGKISNEALKDTANETSTELKSTSPKRSGEYASSWAVKKSGDAYIVYNRRYRLTHLLENGHMIKNKFGTYGRAPAHPHIKNAEQHGISKLLQRLNNEL